MWQLISWIVCREWVMVRLLRRAMRNPYIHISSRCNTEVYMRRWWLVEKPWFKWLPQVRIHHISAPDEGEHLHNHPWEARTILLKGWYLEHFEGGKEFHMSGDTIPIPLGHFHRIAAVSDGGVWTLFFVWPKVREWGFKVGKYVVPHKEYLR